jgi:diadenosine tetraphosphatase ApaH/serine/threonine PP2A family protein phosphatase
MKLAAYVIQLCQEASEIFQSEEPLLQLSLGENRCLVVGDTHGDLQSSVSAVSYLGKKVDRIIFLGDYVDRGPQQIENIDFLLQKKVENKDKIYLLRGNHETDEMNKVYGFYETVLNQFDSSVYDAFEDCFSFMPYAAILDESVFLTHGGLPMELNDVQEINKIERGKRNPKNNVAFQLLWNDPRENLKGFQRSERGEGIYYFGENALTHFLERESLDLFVRAHEVFAEGFRWFFNRKLLSLFSCRYYLGVKPQALLLDGKDVKVVGL